MAGGAGKEGLRGGTRMKAEKVNRTFTNFRVNKESKSYITILEFDSNIVYLYYD
jgi:hypothetical protein